jgi:uncharacterized protein
MATDRFVVHVAKLRRSLGTRWHEVRCGPIEGLECSASAVPDGADVEADVVLESVAGGVSVQGTLSAPWVGECRRCLSRASGTLRLPVFEHFTVGGDGSDTYPLVGDELDLEPMIRDAVVLELPQAPLCRPGCRGLCPVCGADRNVESCSCEDSPIDPRWAALGALKFGDGGTGGVGSDT